MLSLLWAMEDLVIQLQVVPLGRSTRCRDRDFPAPSLSREEQDWREFGVGGSTSRDPLILPKLLAQRSPQQQPGGSGVPLAPRAQPGGEELPSPAVIISTVI